MASWFSRLRKKLEKLQKLEIALLIIHFILILFMGFASIIVSALTLSNVSKIDTDSIKPLMDTITVDGIQPLVAVKNMSILFVLVGVFIIMMILPVVIIYVLADNQNRKLVLVMHTSIILMLILLEGSVISQLINTNDTVKNEIKSKMNLALNHFKADATTNSNSVSNAWNILFMTLDCCGVNPVVSTTNDFDVTSWCTTSGSCQATSSQIPKTCCLNVDENTYSSAPTGCHASVNSGTYNREGCYDALKETLLTNSSYVIGFVSTTLTLEAPALVIGVILFRRYYKKVDQLE